MKPTEKNLERLTKKIIRGEEIDSAALLFHWNGLQSEGDLGLIHLLNRQNGWEQFLKWASGKEEMREKLKQFASMAGIPAKAIAILRLQGFEANPSSGAAKAVELQIRILEGNEDDWPTLQADLESDPELIAGFLLLLESSATEKDAAFAQFLLQKKWPRALDQRIRRTIYALKQKGIQVERSQTAAIQRSRELFAFGENKLPQWQPFLYFRLLSPYSDTGDLYIFRIMEGIECAEPEQHRNLTLTTASFMALAAKYSNQLEQQIRIPIAFHQISPEHARFMIKHSAGLLEGKPGAQHLIDFLKFAGEEPRETIFIQPDSEPDPNFLKDSYFSHWLLTPHDVEPLSQELKDLDKGIILTGSSLAERQRSIVNAFTSRYFDAQNRKVWSYLFAKAAFFLESGAVASGAHRTSSMLPDESVPVEEISAIGMMVERTLEMVRAREKAKEEEERKGSLIMTPEEFEKQRRR